MKVMSVEISVGLPLPRRSTFTGPNPWYLYLMVKPWRTKIGISHDPHKRRKQLSTRRSPDLPRLLWYCEIADRATEPKWHKRFADRRLDGEWFNLSLADISEIAYTTTLEIASLGPREAGWDDEHFTEYEFGDYDLD